MEELARDFVAVDEVAITGMKWNKAERRRRSREVTPDAFAFRVWREMSIW